MEQMLDQERYKLENKTYSNREKKTVVPEDYTSLKNDVLFTMNPEKKKQHFLLSTISPEC